MTNAPRTTVARLAENGIRCATLAVFVEGLRRRNPNAVANAALMVLATRLPDIAEGRYGIEFRPWQRVYTAVTMLAHAAGFLGPYDETWWWDHVTHVLSATLLGGCVHVAAHRRGHDPDRAVIASIMGGGILWECLEYSMHRVSNRLGVEPLLVHYGPRDTVKDILFDLLGALLVRGFGDRLLRNFTERADGGSRGRAGS